MERIFFEMAHTTAPCERGWHLMHTVEGEPIYFRRADRHHYLFGPVPNGDHTTLVMCAPNEGPWLCEACGAFVVTESCRLVDAA